MPTFALRLRGSAKGDLMRLSGLKDWSIGNDNDLYLVTGPSLEAVRLTAGRGRLDDPDVEVQEITRESLEGAHAPLAFEHRRYRRYRG